MYKKIIAVKPIANYRLVISFDNSETRLLDMTPYLNKGIFLELKDVHLFNTAHVSFDTIEWDNQADLDPEFIYDYSSPYNIQSAM